MISTNEEENINTRLHYPSGAITKNLQLKDLFSLTSSGGASIKNLRLKNLFLLILKFIKLIKIYTYCSCIHVKPKIKNDK